MTQEELESIIYGNPKNIGTENPIIMINKLDRSEQIMFSNYSNFLSVMSVSYDAGIPIVDCLHLAVITLTNSVMKNKLR